MAVIRNCVCCGKSYEYCPGCHRKDQPAWMATFCSEPCKELFNIVSAYNVKRISKPVVKDYVLKHNINLSKYVGSVRRALDEVMKVEETALPKPEVKPEPIVEKKEEKKVSSSPVRVVRSVPKADVNENHPRRNKKRRNRQMDIELN